MQNAAIYQPRLISLRYTAGILSALVFANSGHAVSNESAPSILWQKSYGGNASEDAKALVQTVDGGYLLGGYSDSFISGEKTTAKYGFLDYWIVRTDDEGNKLWENGFGGTLADYLTSAQQTADGGYIVGGYSDSPVSGNKTSRILMFDYWVVKVDASGAKVWDKTFGGDSNDYLTKIALTSDGGYLLAGYSSSSAHGSKTSPSRGVDDYWIVKIDAAGTKVWEKSFGGTGADKLYTIRALAGGGFILGGGSASGISGTKTIAGFGGTDFWIIEIDAAGEVVWEKVFGGSGEDVARAVARVDDGYLLAGSSDSPPSGNKTSTHYGGNDWWMIKINLEGEKVWETSFGGTEEDFPEDVAIDGNVYLVAGYTFSGVSGNKTEPNYGSVDGWVLMIDSEGNKIWEKGYGGIQPDMLRNIRVMENGSYAVAGYSMSPPLSGNKASASYGGHDFWMLKLQELPLLRTRRDGTTLTLSWPERLPYVLQQSSSLATGDWTTVNESSLTNGSTVSVSIPIASQRQFFRLKK